MHQDEHERQMLLHAMNGEQRCLALGAVLCCSLFVVPSLTSAQNLVPNPSFEEYLVCPSQPGFLNTSQPRYWYEWDQSPEYFNACAGSVLGDSLVDVPWNGMSFQYAYDGDAYVGAAAFLGDEFHELFGAQLLNPMVPGQTYYASVRVNLAMNGNYWQVAWACNNLGMLFVMNDHPWGGHTDPEFAPRNYAQVYTPEIVTDTANWILVSGSFIADSAYRYIVLGNFFDDAHTDTLVLAAPSGAAYYLFDDVCVSSSPTGCALQSGTIEHSAEHLNVYPNPAAASANIVLGQGMHDLRVSDVIGRACWVFRTGAPAIELDVSEWEAGRYFVEITSGNGERRNGSFVVMH